MIASTRPCGFPAGRTRTGTLKPGDVEESDASTCEESERGTADRGPRSHQPADHSNRCEHQDTERHEADCSSASEKCPRPEPTAAGDMGAKRWIERVRTWPPSRLMKGLTKRCAKRRLGRNESRPVELDSRSEQHHAPVPLLAGWQQEEMGRGSATSARTCSGSCARSTRARMAFLSRHRPSLPSRSGTT
jgi:hypothetical protein